MRSFWIGASVAVIISVVTGVGLNVVGHSSASKFSTPAVRLGH